MNDINHRITQLNADTPEQRLSALRHLRSYLMDGTLPVPATGRDVNNHIHTCYSFSPYSPTKAVWMAYQAGLATAGIIDHDSLSGAREFLEAGEIIGLPTTIGAELRVSFAGTPFADRRINNPDQAGIAYVTFHGIPHRYIDEVREFFAPIGRARDLRNRRMTETLQEMLRPVGVDLDYDRDVLPLSHQAEGGSVTERHLLYAVALKILAACENGDAVVDFLSNRLRIALSAKAVEQLNDPANPCLAYDVLNVLKSELVSRFYVPATDECLPVAELMAFTKPRGIILAYPYLGDVGDSVTGDKKTQTFEDAYLDELFESLQEMGFDGITYMPSRNTPAQLKRLRELADRFGFFQISGEDINQPRQAFVCEAMRSPEFANLYEAAWALIGHEYLSGLDSQKGFFTAATIRDYPLLADRTAFFAKVAQERHIRLLERN